MIAMKHESTPCSFEALEARRLFAAGALDTSFSLDGKATFAANSGTAYDVAMQSDGKTVVVGQSADFRNFVIARFNLDGSPDTSFGPAHTGQMEVHVGPSSQFSGARAVAIQPDGRIVVAGYADAHDMALLRLLPSGALDTRFGSGGAVTTDLDVWDVGASDLAIQRDGKIVVGGSSLDTRLIFGWSDENMFLARFNANGSMDDSFGDDGKRFIDFGGQDFGNAIAIDYNGTAATNHRWGTIVIAGNSDDNDSLYPVLDSVVAVARLTPSGAFDATFGDGGRVMDSFNGAPSSQANGVLIEPGSRVVVAGAVRSTLSVPNNENFAVARFRVFGTPDTTFGTGGRIITSLHGNDFARDVVRSVDGGLIVGGVTDGAFGLVKYTVAGALDAGFGQGGKVITPMSDTAGVARLAYGPGKRIVAVGGQNLQTNRYLDAGARLVQFPIQLPVKPVSSPVFSERKIDDVLESIR
jgi:uncharacterized delta-60 repeat protein